MDPELNFLPALPAAAAVEEVGDVGPEDKLSLDNGGRLEGSVSGPSCSEEYLMFVYSRLVTWNS